MADCYICNAEITDENQSKEHIFLNAIGGKLKSYKLLCRHCNSKIGHDADGELAKQFQFMSGYLQVKRDKGKTPVTKGGKLKDGTGIELVDGITPKLAQAVFKATVTENGINYHLVAREEKEMKQMLNGLKKKYPEFNVDVALRSAMSKKTNLRDPVSFSQTFGGELAFRSIAKSAVNFFIYNKGVRKEIEGLIPYLMGQTSLEIVKHFHPKKSAYQKDSGEIIHLIHLHENRQRNYFIALLNSLVPIPIWYCCRLIIMGRTSHTPTPMIL